MVYIRKAKVTDRNNVALCIAEGFEKDFSVLCKDNQKVADAITAGLNIERFYVADINGNIEECWQFLIVTAELQEQKKYL